MDNLAGRAVNQHGEEQRNPVTPMSRETEAQEELEEVLPGDGIESFGEIELHQQGRLPPAVESAGDVPDKQEVVVDATRLEEGALHGRDELPHERREATSKNLGEELGERANETNWAQVVDGVDMCFLPEQEDEGRVESCRIAADEVVKMIKGGKDVELDDRPAGPVESAGEAVWPWRLLGWGVEDGVPDLIQGEGEADAG